MTKRYGNIWIADFSKIDYNNTNTSDELHINYLF